MPASDILEFIFIIDDDEEDVNTFKETLQEIKPSVRCESAPACLKAIEMLNRMAVLPDIILLDLNMPVMSGKQCLVLLKSDERLRDIPVVILTTSDADGDKTETEFLKAHSFFTKPDSLVGFKVLISKVLSINGN